MADASIPARAEPSARATGTPTNLLTDQGRTTIASTVVAKIAGLAAREVPGVHALAAQGAGEALAGLTQRITGSDLRSYGVNVEVGEREAIVSLRMTVDYGVSIPQVAEAVRRNIINRIQAMTGLLVKEVNIDVIDLYFPDDEQAATTAPPERRVQ